MFDHFLKSQYMNWIQLPENYVSWQSLVSVEFEVQFAETENLMRK
jgi:hypothetical protein